MDSHGRFFMLGILVTSSSGASDANAEDRALQFFDAALQRRQNWGRASEQPATRAAAGGEGG